MDVIGIRTPSLGDTTYIFIRDGVAVIVDPQRDVHRFLEVIEERNLTLTHVLETHVHNDYISGGRDLAARTGADLVLPAGAGAGFAFVPAFHHEDFEVSPGTRIRPVHTPGHTPEHVSYVAYMDDVPHAAFTGGSLLVGAAGRSDLLGDAYAHQLAVLQFDSLQRLAALPDATGVYPTHGEGSFCTASGAGRTTSTIGREKAENPLLAYSDAATFAADQLSGLVPYPAYYAHMGPANREGPTALRIEDVPELEPDAVAAHLEDGGAVLDGRDREIFAAGHIPGSIGIELGTSFAPWAGWLLPFNVPVVVVLEAHQDPIEAATELSRIGFERVVGVLIGTEGWQAVHRPLASFRTASIDELTAAMAEDQALQVVDVRDPQEWKAGHIAGSVHHYVPQLLEGLPTDIDPDRPVWLVCRTGNRSTIAAGLVERLGAMPVVVTKGGIPDVIG